MNLTFSPKYLSYAYLANFAKIPALSPIEDQVYNLRKADDATIANQGFTREEVLRTVRKVEGRNKALGLEDAANRQSFIDARDSLRTNRDALNKIRTVDRYERSLRDGDSLAKRGFLAKSGLKKVSSDEAEAARKALQSTVGVQSSRNVRGSLGDIDKALRTARQPVTYTVPGVKRLLKNDPNIQAAASEIASGKIPTTSFPAYLDPNEVTNIVSGNQAAKVTYKPKVYGVNDPTGASKSINRINTVLTDIGVERNPTIQIQRSPVTSLQAKVRGAVDRAKKDIQTVTTATQPYLDRAKNDLALTGKGIQKAYNVGEDVVVGTVGAVRQAKQQVNRIQNRIANAGLPNPSTATVNVGATTVPNPTGTPNPTASTTPDPSTNPTSITTPDPTTTTTTKGKGKNKKPQVVINNTINNPPNTSPVTPTATPTATTQTKPPRKPTKELDPIFEELDTKAAKAAQAKANATAAKSTNVIADKVDDVARGLASPTLRKGLLLGGIGAAGLGLLGTASALANASTERDRRKREEMRLGLLGDPTYYKTLQPNAVYSYEGNQAQFSNKNIIQLVNNRNNSNFSKHVKTLVRKPYEIS